MTLKEKLDYEYQLFFLDKMRTSRENIFASSAEIELKKQLYKMIPGAVQKAEEGEVDILLWQDNLLESAYCFATDVREGSLPEKLEGWLAFVTGGGGSQPPVHPAGVSGAHP